MIANPWRCLPDRAPFVLPEDEAAIQQFNDRARLHHNLQLRVNELLPEPFIGDRKAPVVLLSNNPGVGKAAGWRGGRAFMDKMRRNLQHEPSDYPFVYLDPAFEGMSIWWARKLKELLARFGRQVVSQAILNVPYFPYPSKRYAHSRCPVPSQAYSVHLVREAVKRGAVIVRMRKRAPWLAVVPELNGYAKLFEVRNWQNPAISRRNCDGFEAVVRAIESRH